MGIETFLAKETEHREIHTNGSGILASGPYAARSFRSITNPGVRLSH